MPRSSLRALPAVVCAAFGASCLLDLAPARPLSAPSTGVLLGAVPSGSPPSALPPATARSEPGPALASLLPDLRPLAERQWAFAADEDGAACRDALRAAGAKFQPVPDRPVPDAAGCGMPHGVVLRRGASGIAYSPPLLVDCTLALALVDVERILQEEAQRELGSPIVRMGNLGAFACRNRTGALRDRKSEHAFGVAVDLSSFEPKKGRAVTVLRDYPRGGAEPTTGRGRFLRAVWARLHRETSLTHIVGPDYNAAHRDHFHLDRGLRAWF